MPTEIEKKFLVVSDAWKSVTNGETYCQGYLSTDKDRTIRVRIEGSRGKLTIKGEKRGASAPEFEYEIPIADARFLLDNICISPLVEKTRYRIRASDGHVWEVDEFTGVNAGLVVAEIELSEENEHFDRPSWLGEDITTDFRYANSRLTEAPFSTWARRS